MVYQAASKPGRQIVLCDCCGGRIRDLRALRLMRRADALPEECAVYHVHAHCAEDFQARRPGLWNGYDCPSSEASWLLPMAMVCRLMHPLMASAGGAPRAGGTPLHGGAW